MPRTRLANPRRKPHMYIIEDYQSWDEIRAKDGGMDYIVEIDLNGPIPRTPSTCHTFVAYADVFDRLDAKIVGQIRETFKVVVYRHALIERITESINRLDSNNLRALDRIAREQINKRIL